MVLEGGSLDDLVVAGVLEEGSLDGLVVAGVFGLLC